MDRREHDHKWYDQFDDNRMVLVLEGVEDDGTEMVDVEIPARYEICGTCEGRGSHVNPSIDSNGLSADDFAEDPDFAEDYMSGAYDVPCAECRGKRVVPVVDEERATEQEKRWAEERIDGYYTNLREEAAERRYGY